MCYKYVLYYCGFFLYKDVGIFREGGRVLLSFAGLQIGILWVLESSFILFLIVSDPMLLFPSVRF